MNLNLKLQPADYVIIVGYLVLVVWIGLWFRHRLTNVGDYFAGGNQVPWWLAGISHYMSSFSAFAFLAYAQIGYTYGWVAVTLFWLTVPACLAGGAIFAPLWRRARIITPVEFLEVRFSPRLRQVYAWAGIPMKIFDDALKIFATSIFFSVVSGLSLPWSIFICTFITVGYTFSGGLWALVAADYVQFLMKSLAILLMVPLAFRAVGGMHHAFTGYPPGFNRLVSHPYNWTYLAGFACLVLINYNASWSLAQKYYCVPNEKDASKAAYLAALLNWLGAPLMILPAILGRHFLPDLIAQGRTADTYVLLVIRLLPEGMVGIILAAMFSATMATASADFNAIAGVLTQDVYHRLLAKDASEKHLLQAGRWITLVLGVGTMLLSLVIARQGRQSLFETMVAGLGIFVAPTLLPMLAGLSLRWVTARGAFAGFIAGIVTGLTMFSMKQAGLPFLHHFGDAYTYQGIQLLLTTGMTIAGTVVGSVTDRPSSMELSNRSGFFKLLQEPVPAVQRTAENHLTFTPVLAVSTWGVGLLLALSGLVSHSPLARWLDGSAALLFVLLGFSFQWKRPLKTRV